MDRKRSNYKLTRRLARETAFKALFLLDFNPEEGEDLAIENSIENTIEIVREKSFAKTNESAAIEDELLLSEENLAYVKVLFKEAQANLEKIDKVIVARYWKEGWQLSRIMSENKNLSRLIVYELRLVEPKATKVNVMNEAVELAKRYETALEEVLGTSTVEEELRFSEKNFAYIKLLVKGTRANLEEIDGIIVSHLKESWQFSRLMTADKNILRLAVYEMRFVEPNIPKSIAINEAVELAKKYGTDESGRFVNGILEAISK